MKILLKGLGVKSTNQPRESTNQPFVKHDDRKLRWSLLPWKELQHVVATFMSGAKKYGDFNWRLCKEPEKYLNAALRHIVNEVEWATSEEQTARQEQGTGTVNRDIESGIPTVSHAIASLLIYHALVATSTNTKKETPQNVSTKISNT